MKIGRSAVFSLLGLFFFDIIIRINFAERGTEQS